jgi:hypothetical protein
MKPASSGLSSIVFSGIRLAQFYNPFSYTIFSRKFDEERKCAARYISWTSDFLTVVHQQETAA